MLAVRAQISDTIRTPRSSALSPMDEREPAFVALPIPQSRGTSLTVRFGGFAIDVANDADGALVEHVLCVVSRL
jgi:hypothetical protein